MNENEQDKQFIDNVRKALNKNADRLDADTQSKLARVRRKALDAGERKGFGLRQWFTLPVAGWAATAAALVIGLAVYLKAPGVAPADFEDIDILAAEDNLEFYDGLEFYAWLAEEEADAG